MATGEKAGTWGTLTNNNLNFFRDVFGYIEVAMTANRTLTIPDASTGTYDGRAFIIKLTGTTGGSSRVLDIADQAGSGSSPGGAADILKPFLIIDGTTRTGSDTITFKVTGQTGIVIPPYSNTFCYKDGTDIRSSGLISVRGSAGTAAANLTGAVRGSNNTTAATHSSGDAVTQHATGIDNILECNYRITSTSIDSPMTAVSRSQYQGYSNKTATGIPTSFFVERFIDRTTITVYLTPNAAVDGNRLNFYYTRRIQDAGAYSNATNVPYRFVPCMAAGLAYYLSQKNMPQRSQELKLFYEDELARAVKEDADITSTYIAPKVYYPDTAT
jgi:hypothetical protein